MPTLQIRDMPDDVYQGIALAAKAGHRSMAQQAVVELRRALLTDYPDRRAAVIARLRASDRRLPAGVPTPEQLVRDDRDSR